jgi:chromate transporter
MSDRPSHGQIAQVFLRISLLGFGGPNVHIALMLDEVVERRRWMDRVHFLELVGVTNLLPGPNSSETAIHIGYSQRGWTGALTAGLAFLAPTFVMVTALAHLYFRFGTLPAFDPIFWGLKPVILAVILAAGIKLGRAAVSSPLLVGLAGVGAAVAALQGRWVVAAMVLGGTATWAVWKMRGGVGEGPDGDGGEASTTTPSRRGVAMAPLWLPAGALASAGTLGTVFLTHLWIGSVLFGGGYVLIALLQPYAVTEYGWLTSAQFLDGVALTQAVPGPISTLGAFVGYAAAGVPGAIAGTAGVYIPAFAAVLLVAPHLERLRSQAQVKAALGGVSAVVAGAILGVAATLAPPALPDLVSVLLFLTALALLVWRKSPAFMVVLMGLVAGALQLALA